MEASYFLGPESNFFSWWQEFCLHDNCLSRQLPFICKRDNRSFSFCQLKHLPPNHFGWCWRLEKLTYLIILACAPMSWGKNYNGNLSRRQLSVWVAGIWHEANVCTPEKIPYRMYQSSGFFCWIGIQFMALAKNLHQVVIMHCFIYILLQQ